jgi:hypothetical protein
MLPCRIMLVTSQLKFTFMERDSTPPPLDKEPRCVKCGGKMRFSCVEEEKPGFVHHVYECTKCRSTQSFVTPR